MDTGSHGVNGSVSVNHVLTNKGEGCLGSSQPLPYMSLPPTPIQNWSVCPLKQLSCLCFFWCCEVHQYSSGLERQRLIFSRGSWVTRCQHQHCQQGQILSVWHFPPSYSRQSILPPQCCRLGRSAEDRKGLGVTPTLILARAPNWEHRKIT